MANKSRDNYYKTHESNLHDYNSDYRLCISLRTKEGDSGEEEIIQRLEELGYKQSEGENIDDAKIGEYMLLGRGWKANCRRRVTAVDLSCSWYQLSKWLVSSRARPLSLPALWSC